MYAAIIAEEDSGVVWFCKPTATREEAEDILVDWRARDLLDNGDPDDEDRDPTAAELSGARAEFTAGKWRIRVNGLDLAQVVECDE
jgi:hypothetical protein